MKLMFYDGVNDKEEFIDDVDTSHEAAELIKNYVDSLGFKSYYYRWWVKDNVQYCDYGSHTQLFKIYTKE